ncbi:MAG: transposase [Hyphomonadaceae bacterium]|nr:transposase [Hyphomonadaceae bacterium]MBP9233112.1 integrase core domain-containing protein [Hyphomonadaceae bacterium]
MWWPVRGAFGLLHARSLTATEVVAAVAVNESTFDSLAHARSELARRRYDYNHVRPHGAHGGATPASVRASAAVRPDRVDGPAGRLLAVSAGSG